MGKTTKKDDKEKSWSRHNAALSEFFLHAIIWIVTTTILAWNFNLDNVLTRRILVLCVVPYVLLFFINYFVLLPKLLFKNKIVKFALSLTALILFMFAIFLPWAITKVNTYSFKDLEEANYYYQLSKENDNVETDTIVRLSKKTFNAATYEHQSKKERYYKIFEGSTPFSFWGTRSQILNMILFAYLTLGFSSAIRHWYKTQDDHVKMEDLQKQNLSNELEYLKLQINPHFFMNTLNNIHALIDIDGELAKETIIELSKIMRYVLYDCSHQWVPLSNGIIFMDNFIDIMKIRYSTNIQIEKDFPKDNVSNTFIVPLVFAPFVENAFKHGVDINEPSFIKIGYNISEKNITFFISNSIHHNGGYMRELGYYSAQKSSGIGLENVIKRLELLFKGHYLLDINKTDVEYKVTLTMPIAHETSPGVFEISS